MVTRTLCPVASDDSFSPPFRDDAPLRRQDFLFHEWLLGCQKNRRPIQRGFFSQTPIFGGYRGLDCCLRSPGGSSGILVPAFGQWQDHT